MKEFLKKNILPLCLLLVGEIAIITSSIIFKSSPLTICCSALTLIYVTSTVIGVWFSPILGLGAMGLYVAQNVLVSNWGEVILNCGIVIPLLVFGLITYFKNKKKEQIVVEENQISWKELLITISVCLVVSVGLYFLLYFLKTPHIYVATVSVFITIFGNYLFVRRDRRMFLGFGLNNLVLIILWLMPIISGQEGGGALVPIAINYSFIFLFNIIGIASWIKSLIENKKNKTIEKNEKSETQEEK